MFDPDRKIIKYECDPYAKNIRIAPVVFQRRRQMLRTRVNEYCNNEVLTSYRFDSNAHAVLVQSKIDDKSSLIVLDRMRNPIAFSSTSAFKSAVSVKNTSINNVLFKHVPDSIYYNCFNFNDDYELRLTIEIILRVERAQLIDRVEELQHKAVKKRTPQEDALLSFIQDHGRPLLDPGLSEAGEKTISEASEIELGSIQKTVK
jgi:hypothetical protein